MTYVYDFVGPTNVVESEMPSKELQYGTESGSHVWND